jgi:hypothetical protein
MTENSKFYISTFIAIIGALSWFPFLIDLCKSQKICGKVISRYYNESQDKSEIYLIYKLSVVSINKDFVLKDINVNVKYENLDIVKETALNNRKVIFNIDGKNKRLNVNGSEFLNNYSILNKEKPENGYIVFKTKMIHNSKLEYIEFQFNSFDEKENKFLRFYEKDIDERKLFFDDSIWVDII